VAEPEVQHGRLGSAALRSQSRARKPEV